MKPQTLTEKLLRRNVAAPIAAGSEFFRIPADLVLGHDATIALLIERFKQAGRQIWNPARCFFAADHFTPPSTPERADILHRYLTFMKQESVSDDLVYRGISHQLLVEDRRCQPGMVICGADSHTVMAGALGAFACGMGSTDILALLLTGFVILAMPASIRVEFAGTLPDWLFGKDLALEIIRQLGEGGAVDRSLEYHDRTTGGIPMESRFTIANMAVEAGATNGVFVPDEPLRRYLAQRDGEAGPLPGFEGAWLVPDEGAAYVQQLRIDVGALRPLVALPGDLGRIVPAGEVEPRAVQQVFIGSCAGGRLEDLAAAARVLRGRRVAPGVRLVVTPASQAVFSACLRNGIFDVLSEAGAMITNSSCGACGGIDKGLIGAGEVCVSTSNRNFRGRMGSPEGLIYLASPLTAAAAAVTGTIGDPRDVLDDGRLGSFHTAPWPAAARAAGGAA
ncbi:MAG TPA: aconitase/3-isopropylmalate dehydratase large subunit family protein [Kofleriaceae bacterium]|nr:aconitase/3-isopropylmalate dehydratase large subunit family protein [Kofleriaceae bacterium]